MVQWLNLCIDELIERLDYTNKWEKYTSIKINSQSE